MTGVGSMGAVDMPMLVIGAGGTKPKKKKDRLVRAQAEALIQTLLAPKNCR